MEDTIDTIGRLFFLLTVWKHKKNPPEHRRAYETNGFMKWQRQFARASFRQLLQILPIDADQEEYAH